VNDFETVREALTFSHSTPETSPSLAALDRIEAEVERLRAAIEEHDCAPVRDAADGRPSIVVGGDQDKLRAALAKEEA